MFKFRVSTWQMCSHHRVDIKIILQNIETAHNKTGMFDHNVQLSKVLVRHVRTPHNALRAYGRFVPKIKSDGVVDTTHPHSKYVSLLQFTVLKALNSICSRFVSAICAPSNRTKTVSLIFSLRNSCMLNKIKLYIVAIPSADF